jgi:hypothetical protein
MVLYIKFPRVFKYIGITIFPFIFINKDFKYSGMLTWLIPHEKIHIRQQLECLIIPFYIIYLTNFLYNLIRYREWRSAYLNLKFEREAYTNHNNSTYYKTRRCFSWLKYRGE